jgi:hypothetical protein
LVTKKEEPDIKKTASILLTAALLFGSLAGCAGGGGDRDGGGDGGGGGGKSDAVTLSPEATGITMSNGVSIELGDYVLDGEAELTVAKQPVEENKDEGLRALRGGRLCE